MSSVSHARLLLVDDPEADALAQVLREASESSPWDVLLVGRSAEWLTRRAAAPPGLRFLDPRLVADDAHEDVHRYVSSLVRDLRTRPLGGRTLGALFGSHWWYLEITEQGPYRGPFIGRLFQVAVIARFLQSANYVQVKVALRDASLAAVFSSQPGPPPGWAIAVGTYLWRLGRAAVKLLVTRVTTARVRTSPGTLRGALAVFSLFPLWWNRATSAAPQERFFTTASASARDRFMVWGTAPRVVAPDLVFLQPWARLRDLPWLGWLRIRTFVTTMAPHLRCSLGPCDVSPLVTEELLRSMASDEVIEGPVVTAAVRRATAAHPPRAVLYRLEWQPIEHALLMGLPDTVPGIGYLHYPFGRRYLSMQFSRDEWQEALAGPPGVARPIPRGIVTSGPALAAHVTDQGFPSSQVAFCGPQRYPRLIGRLRQDPLELRQRLGLPLDGPVIVIAPAILASDSEALAAALLRLAGLMPGLTLVLKTHPNQPEPGGALSEVLEAWGSERARVMPTDGELYLHLEAADALVCIGSMIAFEAMALGVMPIVFENPSTYAATSLSEYREGLFIVQNGESLVAAVRETLEAGPGAAARRGAWPAMLTAVLGDLTHPPGDRLTACADNLVPRINGAHEA